MTDNEINVAIAEACGYFPCDLWKPFNSYSLYKDCVHPKCYATNRPRNYVEDLNAMHEAEKTLPNIHLYWRKLWDVVNRRSFFNISKAGQFDWADFDGLVNATSRQRAEAFLLTIGKLANGKIPPIPRV